jgi:retron-type reverse transcriptase
MKRCWQLIEPDYYRLCADFHSGQVHIESINDSLITLVLKNLNPEAVNDFRPISLLNSSLKIITNILADRLQEVILQLIHKNQYGFIKSRTIHDCLAWCFEYIHQCKHSRRQAIILKLDFEKAFDTVEHSAIIQILEHMGFPPKWVQWINNILSSGTSAVTLNGALGRKFKCKRGVRQGDPLSPLIFVLATELLQILVNRAAAQGLL